jgi:hypothetical protein
MPVFEPPPEDFSRPCPALVPDLLRVLVPTLVLVVVLVEPRTDVSPRVVEREWIERRSSMPTRWPRRISMLVPPPRQPKHRMEFSERTGQLMLR